MSRNRTVGGFLGGALVGLVLGCATPSLPPDEATTFITSQTIRRAQELYLHPDKIDQRMMVGALDRLERYFDSIRFDESDSGGTLWVGTERAYVPLDSDVDPESFRQSLGRALYFVEQHLGEEMPEDEDFDLEMLALQGALSSLDRYCTIFSGRSTEDFQIRFSGKLKGIGARIGRRDGQLIAVNVFPGSPAEKGGLRDGDAILYVDGDPTQPLTVSEAVGRIRGTAGTPVTLGIQREEEQMDLKIIRGEVRIPTVSTRLLSDGIGYARIETMSRSTVREFREKLQELNDLSGLVLDLRGNTGGSMRTATRLADLFLDDGTIVRVQDREDPESLLPRNRADAKPRVVFHLPTIILVDPATASAAEILAGALEQLDRVRLVGQETFGKGLVQRVVRLPGQKLLKLTVGEYLLADDRRIHEDGIEPEIVLFPVSSERLGRLARVPSDTLPYVRTHGEDDTFPIDVAEALLSHPPEAALADMRSRANQRIQEQLDEHDITWAGDTELPVEELSEELRIRAEPTRFLAGTPTTLHVSIQNPNAFAIPDVWVSLDAPAEHLSNKLVALGTVPPGEVVTGAIELTHPNGIAATEQPVTVNVASGAHPLQSEELVLQVTPQLPYVEIEVGRVSETEITVKVTNRGPFTLETIRLDVPGATRAIETLDPGSDVERGLRLSGDVENVSVTLLGPWARRRIDIPVPEDQVSVVPPEVLLERTGLLGRSNIRVRAISPEGLDNGWIVLNGQKQTYAEWQGESKGQLQTSLGQEEGPFDVVAHVETLTGVVVTEALHFTAN
jgi:carboxyl-terminal processing protease